MLDAIYDEVDGIEKMNQPVDNFQVGGTHYVKMVIQPWDVVDTWPIEQRIGYYRGGALKYIMRMGEKDASLQEIQKAAHYCQKLAEVLDGVAI